MCLNSSILLYRAVYLYVSISEISLIAYPVQNIPSSCWIAIILLISISASYIFILLMSLLAFYTFWITIEVMFYDISLMHLSMSIVLIKAWSYFELLIIFKCTFISPMRSILKFAFMFVLFIKFYASLMSLSTEFARNYCDLIRLSEQT